MGAQGLPPGIDASQLADWPTRALGLLIDIGGLIVLAIIFDILSLAIHPIVYLDGLINLAAAIFLAYQVGTFGSTPGMRMMGLKCISIKDGQVIGTGMAIVRAIAHVVDDIICFVGWFFPFWDSQRQTLADKIMGTIVVKVPKQPFAIMPKTP
jgi:uncharacterized RDD family membrane protein YckC